jgi:YVTN family beta-propeller protein
MTSTYSNQVIPIEINPRDTVTTIGQIQGVNLVDNPLYMEPINLGLIQAIDPSNNSLANTISIPAGDISTTGISPDGKTLYCIDDFTDNLYIVSLLTGATLNVLPQGGIFSFNPLLLSSDGSTLYIPNYSSNTVSVVSTSLQKVIKIIATNIGPSEMNLSPNNSVLYVPCYTSNVINVIDTTTYKLITSISVSGNPINVQMVDNGKKLYVSQYSNSSVSCINTTTNTITATITVGAQPNGMVITPDQQYLYVVNITPGTISVIDVITNTIVTTITTEPSNSQLQISDDGLRVYNGAVTNVGAGNIYVISTVTNTVIATIPTLAVQSLTISPLARFLCGQGRLTLIVDEQVGANKTFQFELTGGIINTSGTPLQNYSYIDNSNKNCSITVNVPNNIQLTTTYGSTFSFQFYPYTTINPTIHRLIRGGGVTSGEVRVTVRDYVSKIIW